MQIPRFWAKAEGEVQGRDKRRLKFAVWGWGADDVSARHQASSRLQRLLDRVRRGEEPPKGYEYGRLPLREEILEAIGDPSSEQPLAVVTRNRYGAQVLNTSGMLFLDIDVPGEDGFLKRVRRMFSGDRTDSAEAALSKLREALQRHNRSTFRLYRTAAGLRAIAVDREFDPAGREAQQLMAVTGTDPAFMRLCQAQRSFRARLTPKPWRCAHRLPPGEHPRTEDRVVQSYAKWLRDYETSAARYATCRYVGTLGSGKPRAQHDKLIALHDRLTRCGEALPLA
jgi:hypothetical protein